MLPEYKYAVTPGQRHANPSICAAASVSPHAVSVAPNRVICVLATSPIQLTPSRSCRNRKRDSGSMEGAQGGTSCGAMSACDQSWFDLLRRLACLFYKVVGEAGPPGSAARPCSPRHPGVR